MNGLINLLPLAHSELFFPDNPSSYTMLRAGPAQRMAMPTTPNRTKKALQEMARVFNKLASELTADLNQAIREIETLKHEVRTIKANRTGPNKGSKQSTTHRKTTSRTATHTNPSHSSSVRTSGSNTSHHASHNDSSKSNQESPYVFPQEPFNPPTPPEAPAPGNN